MIYSLLGRIIQALTILVLLVLLIFLLLASIEAMAEEKPTTFASDLVCQNYSAQSTADLDRCLKCVQLSGFWSFGLEPVHNTTFFVHGVSKINELHDMGITHGVPVMLERCTIILEKDFNSLGGNMPPTNKLQ